MPIGTLPTTFQATAKTTMLAVSILWLGIALAGAQPVEAVERPLDGPGWSGGAGMARALELTDEQKAAFREVLEQHRTKMQSLREKMRQSHQALEAALEGDDPDPASVGKIAIQGRALRKQAEAHREQMNQALREFLTPEQQAKLDALESLRRRGTRFGPGGLGPVGPGGQPPAWPEN
jgi:Spy/CpxP family protein refolding chaperone